MGNLNQNQLLNLKKSKSLKATFETMHALHLQRNHIAQVLRESEKTSQQKLALTARAILLRSQRGDFEEAFELTSWSVTAKPVSRRLVIRHFIKDKQSPLLVHQMSRLKRKDAALMMTDYFEQGGDLQAIAEWLRTAGNILKTGHVPGETDGLWDWIKEGAEAVVDTVVGAINTVADAVKAAGKNLAEAVSTVVSWTQDKVSDFVEAVLAAGKSVSEVLNEAVKKGTAALNKFIQGIIEAGRQGLEVLNWAVNQAAGILGAALRRLEQLYGSFTSLLMEVAKIASSRLPKIIRALLLMGKKVRDFIIRLDRLAHAVAIRIVQEIRKAGKTVKEMVSSLINRSRYIVRVVFEALISLGNTIDNLLRQAIAWSAAQLSRLIGGLKDLGISLSRILDAVSRFAGQQAVKLMQALRKIWKHVGEILQFIAQKTENAIRTLLVALIGTGIHIKNLLYTILLNLRVAFRESLIKGLIQIGQSALTLMKEAVKISASAAAILFAILMDVLGSHRGLNAAEKAEAGKVFGSSIDLDKVKLTDASFAADFIMWLNQNRPFTTMYVINYKSGTTLSMATLIHELTHIWQAVQSGGVYMLEALHSQFFGRGYNLTEADIRKAGGRLVNLEREQQAVLVEEYWKAEYGGQAIPLKLDDIRKLARQVYRTSYRFRTQQLLDLDMTHRFFNPAVPVSS